jgi:hypothetical protein
MVATLLQKLQFVLEIQYISLIIRMHGIVTYTIYQHHPVLGLYGMETK